MPTDIEARYVAQGYTLPAGLTWMIVHIDRDAMRLDPWMVPIEVRPGLSCWGIPTPGRGLPKKA